MVKIRLGFISNSSVTCFFICEICEQGGISNAWEPLRNGQVYCENGHIFCLNHLVNPTKIRMEHILRVVGKETNDNQFFSELSENEIKLNRINQLLFKKFQFALDLNDIRYWDENMKLLSQLVQKYSYARHSSFSPFPTQMIQEYQDQHSSIILHQYIEHSDKFRIFVEHVPALLCPICNFTHIEKDVLLRYFLYKKKMTARAFSDKMRRKYLSSSALNLNLFLKGRNQAGNINFFKTRQDFKNYSPVFRRKLNDLMKSILEKEYGRYDRSDALRKAKNFYGGASEDLELPIISELENRWKVQNEELIMFEYHGSESHGLQEFPLELVNFPHLEQIRIGWGKLKVIPKELAKLKHLQYLELSYTDIQEIPPEVWAMPSLQAIKIEDRNGSIKEPPGWFYGVKMGIEAEKDLTWLNDQLPYGMTIYIQSLPEQKHSFPDRDRQAEGFMLWPWPEGNSYIVCKDGNLIALGLNRDSYEPFRQETIEEFHNIGWHEHDFQGLKKIKSLSMEEWNFSTYPEIVWSCKSLTELSLEYNKLQQPDPRILQLKHLEKINLTDNQITEFPRIFQKSESLRTIYLQSNLITYVPNSVLNLPNIEKKYHISWPRWWLYSKEQENLEEEFWRVVKPPEIMNSISNTLKKRHYLNLSELNLTNDSFIVNNLHLMNNLEFLILAQNNISSFSFLSSIIENMKSINLSHNNIQSLEEFPEKCPNLLHLDLSHNDLSSLKGIPKKFGDVKEIDKIFYEISINPPYDGNQSQFYLYTINLTDNPIKSLYGICESNAKLLTIIIYSMIVNDQLPLLPKYAKNLVKTCINTSNYGYEGYFRGMSDDSLWIDRWIKEENIPTLIEFYKDSIISLVQKIINRDPIPDEQVNRIFFEATNEELKYAIDSIPPDHGIFPKLVDLVKIQLDSDEIFL